MQQFGNAARDLLGLSQAPQLNTNGGTAQYAFFSDDAAGVDPNLQYAIYATTEAVVKDITPARYAELAACDAGEAPATCAARFAKRFGEKAFRRALDEGEEQGLLAVHAEGTKQDFNTGIRLMIEALLQAPSFIYRTELGPPGATPDAKGNVTLSPFEVASQLSFMLADSIPDAALLAAAESGALATEQGIAAEVDRMLGLTPVRQNITQITLKWFNVAQLFDKAKDPRFFEDLSVADQDQKVLQTDVFTASQRFVDEILWQGSGKIDDLVTSRRIYVNDRLAKLYQLPSAGKGAELGPVEAPEAQLRSGILTQPAFLWALSDPATTSIVKRGKFIHDDIICQDPGPPPGKLLDDPEIQAKLAMLPTEIDKVNYRAVTGRCKGCHVQIDPYALVLENFDPIGGFRTEADGKPVDATGQFGDPLPEGPERSRRRADTRGRHGGAHDGSAHARSRRPARSRRERRFDRSNLPRPIARARRRGHP